MTFDPRVALQYAASISRPRRVGSGEDEKVAREIEERLRGWGYHVERQSFTFSTAPEAFLKSIICASWLLVLAMLVSHERSLVSANLAALLLVLLGASFVPLNRVVQAWALQQSGRWLRWGKRYTTSNLIARPSLRGAFPGDEAIPAVNGDCFASFDSVAAARRCRSAWDARNDKTPELYLVAHYDSKSQRMPLVVRVTLFMLSIIAGLILVVLTLLQVSTVLYRPIGLLALASAIPLLFLDVGNTSPGAIDNASSVGLVLHLAELLARRTDWQDKLQVTLLISSAEEMTLMGSVAYVTAHELLLRDQAERGGLHVLNFDGVGVDGELYFAGGSRQRQNDDRISLLTYVHDACTELHLPLKRFGFIGALLDHIPFAQHGFDALSLITVGRASRSVHTPADSIDQLHERGFDQAGRVALHVIERMIGGKA